ncbi:pol [Symbiodinium necroappetens]|uniref:Pol protein n=1 Tax=Symbiodinium necroappetens TaxID=1628268 RepID=A0A812T7J2_9DINO|nr:pol [Symbiodinium necroappetens]
MVAFNTAMSCSENVETWTRCLHLLHELQEARAPSDQKSYRSPIRMAGHGLCWELAATLHVHMVRCRIPDPDASALSAAAWAAEAAEAAATVARLCPAWQIKATTVAKDRQGPGLIDKAKSDSVMVRRPGKAPAESVVGCPGWCVAFPDMDSHRRAVLGASWATPTLELPGMVPLVWKAPRMSTQPPAVAWAPLQQLSTSQRPTHRWPHHVVTLGEAACGMSGYDDCAATDICVHNLAAP